MGLTDETTTGLSVVDGNLEVQRATDFAGWRVTSSALPLTDNVIEPVEDGDWSIWFGVLPANPPEGLSVTELSDGPESVSTRAVDDLDRLVRVACQYR